MFGFAISADGLVTRTTVYSNESVRIERHQVLADQRPPQRLYFSRPGNPFDWPLGPIATIKTMNDPASS